MQLWVRFHYSNSYVIPEIPFETANVNQNGLLDRFQINSCGSYFCLVRHTLYHSPSVQNFGLSSIFTLSHCFIIRSSNEPPSQHMRAHSYIKKNTAIFLTMVTQNTEENSASDLSSSGHKNFILTELFVLLWLLYIIGFGVHPPFLCVDFCFVVFTRGKPIPSIKEIPVNGILSYLPRI